MSKKYAMFSNGTVIVKDGDNTRQASQEEVKEHLISLVPQEKGDSKLKAVRYEDGFVYAKYENDKVFGSYSHITEGIIRAVWLASKDKDLNIFAHSF